MIEQQVGRFQRQIYFMSGFDRRGSGAQRNFGVHPLNVRFALIGALGAVHWAFSTGWYPGHVSEGKPEGVDLGFHSYLPRYEGHEPSECDLLIGGKCYCDGSFCSGEELGEGFVCGGDDWIWDRLEAYYAHVFEGAAYPNFDPIIPPHPDEARQ
jgi:hypothetical protein